MQPDLIIPARMGSSRFFGKPLALIDGVPLVIRVCNRATEAFDKSKIYVATDNDHIARVVEEHGFQVVMTSDKCVTGTDRVAEAASAIRSECVINLQGDEPLVRREHIEVILQAARARPDVTHNCYAAIERPAEMTSKNVPKVVLGEGGQLLYASRAPIPMVKGEDRQALGYKQVCIYYFPAADLSLFGESKKKASLEGLEDIEILRLVEKNRTVLMHQLTGPFQAVDEVSDVSIVESLLARGF